MNQPRELGWALRHEAEHLRCHDTRWIYLVRAIGMIQWWNPVLHGLVGVWGQSREQACDLHAIRHPAERPDYGHFLLQIAGGERPRLATWMAAKRKTKRLRRRITTLLEARTLQTAPAGPGWTLAMAGLLVLVGLGSSMLGFANPDSSGASDGDPTVGDPSWLAPTPIVSLQTAILITPEPFAEQGAVFKDAEAKAKLAPWIGRKGVYLQSLSGDFAPAGTPQSLQMTVSRDNLATEPPWDGSKTLSQFVGWVIHYQPTMTGAGIRLGVKAAYAFRPGLHPAPGFAPGFALDLGQRSGTPLKSPVLPIGMAWGDMVLATADEMATIPPGRILCTSLGEVEKGVYAQCLTGVDLRMPWEHNGAVFTSIRKPQGKAEALQQARAQEVKLTIDRSPAGKALALEVAELAKRLKAAIDAYPTNRELLPIRDGLEAGLDAALRNKDSGLIEELRWKIQAVSRRMAENAANDPEVSSLDGDHELKQREEVDEWRANLTEYYRTHPPEVPKQAVEIDKRGAEKLKKVLEDFHRTHPQEKPKPTER